jgi:hypothetical protein
MTRFLTRIGLAPSIRIWIRTEIKSRNRIRTETKSDPQHWIGLYTNLRLSSLPWPAGPLSWFYEEVLCRLLLFIFCKTFIQLRLEILIMKGESFSVNSY